MFRGGTSALPVPSSPLPRRVIGKRTSTASECGWAQIRFTPAAPGKPVEHKRHFREGYSMARSSSRDKSGGTLDKAFGRFKEASGALTGNEGRKARGQGRQAKGSARKRKGHLKDLFKRG